MSDKPKAPILALATPAPTDREKIWAAMRQEKTFTQTQIARLASCRKSTVQDYLRGLIAAGFVYRQSAPKQLSKAVYVLTQDIGVDAPRVRLDGTILPASGRTRMWNAMRILRVFTSGELANAASLPDAPVALTEAKTYCGWLVRGGYLAHNGVTYSFVLAKFTGAKAPQILRVKALYDPNLGKVVIQPAPEGRDDE